MQPPIPVLRSIDGDTFALGGDYHVCYSDWLSQLQFVIPDGYKTDLASVPKALRWYNDRASLGILAPLIHDFLCDQRGVVKTINNDTIQIRWFDAQVYFLVAMRVDNICWHRALLAFLAVLIGAPKW